jgi:lipid II:glycine glycyltransferase (peptidoglycan interpeptide bridge formation enzyme)
MRILGSPLPGWATSYMGFNLKSSVPRADALIALEEFAFRDLKCVHFEVMDRGLSVDDVKKLGYRYRILSGYEIDLNRDEDQIFDEMKSSCRRCIRKANKMGVQVEETKDLSFIDDYYSQLEDVFAKQKLVPTYPKKRIKALIERLLESGLLLLVKATNSKGICIATGIFPAMNDTMYFWGGASWRGYQILRPNEIVQWFAIRYWKAKGITKYDMGGGGEYKKKYGGQEIKVPWVRKSKHSIFEYLRVCAQYLYAAKQRVQGLRKV